MDQGPYMRPTPAPPRKGACSLVGTVLILIFLLIVGAILFPLFASARAAGRMSLFRGNLKKSGEAVFLYGLDNNDRFPIGADWIDQSDNYAESKSCFNLPRELGDVPEKDFYGIALNSSVSGKSFDAIDEADTVVLFCSTKAERNASDNLTSLRWLRNATGSTFAVTAENTTKTFVKGEPTKSKLNGPLSAP